MKRLALLYLALVAACAGSEPAQPDAITVENAPLTGQTGALTVTTANTIVNQYGVLAANVAAGATVITVTNVGDFTATAPFTTGLAAGDLLMIYQPQGATIDATDTAAFGNVTAVGSAGRYELVHVASVVGNAITLETACGGLKSAYTTAGATEVIRVPQLTTLTISGAGSVTARAWDGARGGVAAIQAQTSATIGGAGIDVSGKGFRGGAADDVTTGPPGTTTIRSTSNATGAEKGESIAGYQAFYDSAWNGRFGRGAAANGGGGGDAHNGGGGGGANGNNGNPWTGAGVMANVTGAAAWTLDPEYISNGNARTTSSGGGRGGYTFSGADQDATMVGPNNALWGGDNRRDVGGLGGRPLANDPATRVFLGGGGGAGDGNNTAAGPGGNGGGLVLLMAATVTGTGQILANGGAGTDSMHNPGDAPGGGGAGGSVLVQANALGGIAIHADGGAGGTQTLQAAGEAEGPGGGGGGGFVATRGGTITATANGAIGGTTNAPTVSEFPSNGATSGSIGVANGAITALNACLTDDLTITNTDGKTTVVAGSANTYTVTVTNPGADVVAGATVTETFPAAFTGATWTCVATAGSSCPASGTGDLNTQVTLANGGGKVTFTIMGTVAPGATGNLALTAAVATPAGITDPAAASNSSTDTDTITAPPGADLAMALTSAPNPVAAGGTLTYTATVTNNSATAATMVTVTDALPAGVTFVSATGTGWTCALAGTTVTCTRPALAMGAAPAIAIVVTAPSTATTLSDTASVTATTTDPTPGNNSATTMTTVSAPVGADLAMAISSAPNPVAAGAMLTYTLAVTNNSATTAAMITVTDTLPAGVTFVSAAGTGWTCAQAAGTVTCTRPTLAMGAAPVIAIVVTAPNAGTTLSDTASVAATTPDPTPGNNSATTMTTVTAPPGADLAIALVDTPDPVLIGGVLTYTATVTNNSTTQAMTVGVAITLPAGFTVAMVTGTGWGCTQAAQVVTCTRASIAQGSATPIQITGTAPLAPQTLTATATVSATTADPAPGNNTATATTSVLTAADLSVVVTGAPDPVAPGGTETFTITVTDSGPGNADNVTVTFNLPPGSTFVSATGTGWTCTLAGTTVTCTRPTVTPGMAPPITIVVTMPNTTGSTTATTTVGATTPDPMTGNNTVSTTTMVTPAAGSADLAIAVTAVPSPVALGADYTYAVLVTNNGTDAAQNVTVTDTLPADVAFVGANGTGWTCTHTGTIVSCTVPMLATGTAPAISIAVTAPSTAETVTDTATVAATTPDPMTANNTATVMTLIGQAASADLAISLTDDGPVTTHKTLTYIATVANLGPDAAHNLVVHITVPSDVTSVFAGTDWTCSSVATLVTCKAANVTSQPINVQVLAPAQAGTATATATVGAETADPELANNSATDNAEVDSALTVRGGGCDSTGGSSGIVVLLAVLALLKKRKLAVLIAALVPAIASAQSANFPVERMRISSDRDGLIGVEWADAVTPLTWNIGTWIGYADDPLVVEDRGSGDRAYSIVHRRIGGALFGAIGLTRWLEIGLEIPLVYNQASQGAPTSVSDSPKFGDLRFMPKLVLRGGADRVDVAIMLGFSLESSTSGAYAGDNGATFDPELILSRAWQHWRVSGNLGYLARKTVQFMDLRVDDELYLRAGAGYRFDAPVELDVTYNMATAAAHPFDQINTDPFELDAAVQWDASRDVTLFGLAGFGLGSGFGAPDWRVVAGLRFAWHKRPEATPVFVDPDPDHDGITNDRDRCPNQPEDKDGFQDEDGCPDPDNDGDGIPDVADKCPNEPEDVDGFQDTDGCPDPDNDQDGVLDKDDKCPLEPGPASNGGCPDPDRDGDGVVDRLDNCPDEPGPAENHGCAKKQLVVINNGKLDLVDRVYFRTDKDIIETRSFAILDNVANVLNAHPEITKIRVEGHTDNRGGKAHNQDLSQRRASAVVKYLVAKKVARDRLEPTGFGQDKPIADNDTDTGRATNRRVEFVIVGGQGVDSQATGPGNDTIGH